MGAIIKSVAFQNFYNYYGSYENNLYRFTEGINIISADNNMGKSKFYNGFLWVLHDQVYDSDDRTIHTAKDSYEKMASAKARRENDEFSMGVRIVFVNDDVEYTIERRVHFTKEDGSWKTIPILDVYHLVDNSDMPILDVEKKQQTLRLLIPSEINKYALLQGESIEGLVNLSSNDGLEETINDLADIRNVIEMCELASKLAGRAAKEANDIERKNTKAGSDLADKQAERDKYKKWIDEAEEKIKTWYKELAEAKTIKEECGREISNTTKRAKLRTEYENENEKLKRMEKERDAKELSVTSRLFDENCPWVLYGLKDEIDQFDANRIAYLNTKRDAEIRNNPDILLPEGSPDAPSLKRMLETMVCEVCGRSLKDDPEAYAHVKRILERPQKPVHEDQASISDFFGYLQKNTGSYVRSIAMIDEDFNNFMEALDELNDRIEAQRSLVDAKKNELMMYGVGEHSAESDAILLSKYTQADKKITDLEGSIRYNKSNIEIWTLQYEKCVREIAKKQDNSEVEKARDFAERLANIQKLFEATKERIFNKIVDNLQIEANEMYARLTEGNQTSGGTLDFQRLEDGTVKVRVLAASGEELTGNGTGFQRMKQLALVMSIISSKSANRHFDYPFISDAPFSEFSFNFINNFLKLAPTVFTQSIIMIKDLCDPSRPTLLTHDGDKIVERMNNGEVKGMFYVNYTDTDRPDASDIETKKRCYTEYK